MRPALRLPVHRGTTAHVCSIYPFAVQAPLGRGPFIGLDLLAGGGPFAWDPFATYAAGLVSNPNAWVLGEPGMGKSALVKSLLWRMAAVYGLGPSGRWIAIADPKGEYRDLAEMLGLAVVRLSPGGSTCINPLAPGPAAAHEPTDKAVIRQADMCVALIATVLDRPLTQVEDAIAFAVIDHLHTARTEATLVDVARELVEPDDSIVARLRRPAEAVVSDAAPLAYAVDKLLTRSLRGMFDGPSTVPLKWDGPGLLLDLSGVPLDSEALPLVMVAAAGWLQQLMACPGPPRVQVLDEAWALLGNRHTAAYLQSAFKLGRAYGVSNVCVTHRASDLGAQADDGTSTAKIAAGLLADSATKVILRQAPDQVDIAKRHFGLTSPEARIIGQLARGRALWRVGGRTAVVQHLLADGERALCDTDARMEGRGPGA